MEEFYQRGTPPAPDSVIVYVHTHGGGTYVFEGHSTTLDVVLQVLSATVSWDRALIGLGLTN